MIVQGKVDRRGREPNIVANRIMTLDQADKEFTSQVAIKFDQGIHSLEVVENVRRILSRFPGSTDVIPVVDSASTTNGLTENDSSANDTDSADDSVSESDQNSASGNNPNRIRYILTTGKDCQVSVGPEFQQALKDTIGEEFYELKAASSSNGGGGSIGR